MLYFVTNYDKQFTGSLNQVPANMMTYQQVNKVLCSFTHTFMICFLAHISGTL